MKKRNPHNPPKREYKERGYQKKPNKIKSAGLLQPIAIKGLPKIFPQSLIAFSPEGERLWIVKGRKITRYFLHRRNNEVRAEVEKSIELAGEAKKLTSAPDGAIFALLDGKAYQFSVIEIKRDSDQVRTVRQFSHSVSAMVATKNNIGVVMKGDELTAPQLLILKRNDGRTIRRVALNTHLVKLRIGGTDEILLSEPGSNQLRYVNTSIPSENCETPDHYPEPDSSPNDRPSPSPDCKCGCPPPKNNGRRPGGNPTPPHRSRRPDNQCIPGDDGVPDGCIVTYKFGSQLITVNLCEPDQQPCAVKLNWQVDEIHRTRHSLIATSDDKRRVAIVDANSSRLAYEFRSLRQPVKTMVAPDADLIFLLDNQGLLSLLDPAPVLPALAPGFGLSSGSTSAQHMGTSPINQFDINGRQTGHRNVLIVPVLEPGQGFIGDASAISEDVEIKSILQSVERFYKEASYDKQPDYHGLTLNFIWFGADTPDLYTGRPVEVSKKLKEYWGPGWDPGHIVSTKAIPAGGANLTFSGDEQLRIKAIPSEKDTYSETEFDVRFPAASYYSRINLSTPTIDFNPGMPPRSILLDGEDREGNALSLNIDTTVLSTSRVVDLNRTALDQDGSDELDKLADVIEEMLESDPSSQGIFERPAILWHDDGEENGFIHITLSFLADEGSVKPFISSFDLDGLLPELDSGSKPANFNLPGDVSDFQNYLQQIVADAHVNHPDFGPLLRESYFDLSNKWKPSATMDGGDLKVRISLSTKHGRFPAIIEKSDQAGLDIIGMDNPEENKGADTAFSGGGGPTFDLEKGLYNEVYTLMIDKIVDFWGDESAAVDAINQRFNCVGLEDLPIVCALDMIHNIVVTPVYPGIIINGTKNEPELVNGERDNTNATAMVDQKEEQRIKPVLPISSNRRKIVMQIAPATLASPSRGDESASTFAHELGHGLLGLPDIYPGGKFRNDLSYLGGHCIMGDSSVFGNFCAYNKRIKGWLHDDAILNIDRPAGNNEIDQEVVLVQLEYWDPTFEEETWDAIAQTALSGMSPGTPVKAAVFLKLGGDGRQFDIIELRGPGQSFSKNIMPPRILITNAIDPEDDTRYAEIEVEGAGTTKGVLERYRRKVHLLSSGLQQSTIGTTDAVYNFASDPVFPELGLTVELLEWSTGSTSSGSFDVARIGIHWERGVAVDMGFKDSTPDWQSPDIAIIYPEDIEDGEFVFPEGQEEQEMFRTPPEGSGPLEHKIAVRAWNFGDGTALNVHVELIKRIPAGGGDWKNEGEFEQQIIDEALPSSEAGPTIVAFDWPIEFDSPTHLCFRAQIGDLDVQTDANGLALASNDTNDSNRWAQQNVFEMEARADSPPEPIEFTFQVNNEGSYLEEVFLSPQGLDAGATITITPALMKIAPFSAGYFRVRAVLAEALLTARCGKDISFVLEAWRKDDDSEERWGAAKYIIKPRKRTETILQGGIMPDKLFLFGHVSPDVGAMRVLLQIQRPGQETLWEEVNMGPASTFDFQLSGDFPAGEAVNAVAYYDGSFDFAKSVSKPVKLVWQVQG
jgi:hypothetical protein